MNISDRLNELMVSYHREARRCLRGKAYLGATVMQVAAFEAGLQAMCFSYPEEVKKTTIFARKRFRGKRNRPLEFTLNQLIGIADELAWFPPKRFPICTRPVFCSDRAPVQAKEASRRRPEQSRPADGGGWLPDQHAFAVLPVISQNFHFVPRFQTMYTE